MHATTTLTAHRGTPGPSPLAPAGRRPAVDLASTCGCGQELDTRHVRCTRCGR